MAPAVWKGLLRFGLVSIPIRLYRVAQAEKVSFRQLHKATGARVRHRLCTDAVTVAVADIDTNHESAPAIGKPNGCGPALPLTPVKEMPRSEVTRQDVAKGYEYAKDRYVRISQEELAQLLPPTTQEINLREFVQPAEIERTYFDSTFYVVPDRAGQHAYAVLSEALRDSGLVGVAQVTMHSRESVVVFRTCARGIVAQTLFYEAEIRREREYEAARSAVSPEELTLALQLIECLTVPFEPLKYFDSYREGLQALVRDRVTARTSSTAASVEPAAVSGLTDALERSIKPTARKPGTAATTSAKSGPSRKASKRAAS